MYLSPLHRLVSLILISGLLTACSSSGFFSDQEKAYRSQQEAVDNLEIPPDLSSSAFDDAMTIPGGSSASYSDYTAGSAGATKLAGSQVLPEFEDIKIKRDGDHRWLQINAEPSDVWFKVVEFWRKNGLLLVEQDPSIGIMTTDWLESRANVQQGMLTEMLRKAFDSVYSSATRDQFRVRLERGEEPGTTDLFLTHRGLVEELVKDVSGDANTTYWTPRPNEPETEAAMLRSLMLHLGVSEEQADRSLAESTAKQERSRLFTADDKVELIISERFARAWRLTGVALDRVGFAVEDRDRTDGIYYVRYKALVVEEKKGFFSKLAFWRDDDELEENQYQVKLEDLGSETQVTVNNQQGERQNSKTAIRLLTLLHEQIR
ncbi:MAG: outer membrane protein assembly factor BamC [Gammaproteobacteria bacterium]|nr:outer membrane protein assembly factor BamC [Gammaproteobacteria bacterium]